MQNIEKNLSYMIIAAAVLSGVEAMIPLGSVASILTPAIVLAACILGVLHGSRSNEVQSMTLGCAALVLALLAHPDWGSGGAYVASVPFVGSFLWAAFANGILAVVGIAILSLLSRILVFWPRSRSPRR